MIGRLVQSFETFLLMAYIGHIKLFADGGARGNPGPAAIGLLILDDAQAELVRFAECIGSRTNNQAEYCALIKGLELSAGHTRRRVTVYMDSELVVKQMNGDYRIKNRELLELFGRVKDQERPFEEVVYVHVRDTNPNIRKAHRLLHDALEGR